MNAASTEPRIQTEERGRILVVDEEPRARSAIRTLLCSEGFDVEVVGTPSQALSRLSEFAPHAMLTDVRTPGMNGIRFVHEIRRRRPETVVLIMTGCARVADAVRAVKLGAESYLEKPIDPRSLLSVIDRSVAKARHLEALCRKPGPGEGTDSFSRILGHHPSIQRARQLIQRVAGSDVVVLLSGEVGTGRSLVAAAIHELSPRASGPFVKFGCAALAEPALESELLGCERSSLSGTVAHREGRLRQAEGGTLFLDEISEAPLHTQGKLLRLLQEKRFERVGGDQAVEVDTRVIAATHRDLSQAVAAGSFREDLFYRLNVIEIELPPLRERSPDIPVLCAAMLARFSEVHDKPVEGFSAEALEALCCHSWPGNVRELENVVERAVVLSTGTSIPPTELAPLLERRGEAGSARIPGSTLAEIEREAIVKTLDAVRGSTAKAAQMLGISQRKVQYRIREYEA